MNSKYFCGLLALSSLSAANADVLGQWTFDNIPNVATALQSSAVAPGAFVSGLVINPSHDSAGVNALPNSVNDGYGFGGATDGVTNQAVIFLARANYFNNTPDTSADPPGIRPVGAVTTWDSSNTAVEGQPISFTVTADAISTLTIDSLEVHQFTGSELVGAFQQAGSPAGASVAIPGGQTGTLPLNAPVVIQPGQSATFTMYANSGALDTGHNLNQISLNGTVSRNTTIPPVAQWTFNDTPNVATALQSSGVAAGAFVSSLAINPSHDSAGVNAVPNSVNDGYGFGGNSGQNVMFFQRAEYFNGDPDTDNGGIRPVGRVTTWDSSNTTVEGQPISFTVTADAISTLTINSLEVQKTDGPDLIGAFQQAGSTAGASVTIPGGNEMRTLALNAPVVIQPGQSATFTMYANSGALNQGFSLNQISVNGTVSRNTTIPPVAQWTFDNTGSGTTEERLPVALGASSVASGLTVTQLNINASFVEFAGFNNLPGSVNDGYGFGDNSGEALMFISRANYFNGGSGVTTWGSPTDTPGVDTTVANSPLSFTVTTNSLTTATLNSVNVAGIGIGNVYFVEFQEASATVGVPSAASNTNAIASLRSPLVIGPNQSKTFTINLNSGNLDSGHAFNTISLNGSISTAGNTYANWAADNANNQSAELDFDNDGTENGIEFFMGETGSGFTAMPTLENRLITWERDPTAIVSSFKVQTSDNLATWTDVLQSNLDLSDSSKVRYTLPAGETRIFSRLVVTP